MHSSRRRAAVLCGAVLTTVALSAAALPAAPARAGVPRADAAPVARLAWKNCGTTAHPRLQCASLKVPLDHADPRGRRITLALSRIPHTAKTSQGPLLVNPGGPGGSGLTLAGFVAAALPRKVAAQYDVVGFDPRGVGRSDPALDCAPRHFDPVRPDPVPLAPAVERANLARAKAFAEACGRRYADVLAHIDTVSAARDLDLVRRALGAGRISYFGYSYGTYLGAVYARLYPHRVRRAVLDSVVDPAGVWYRNNLAQDFAFDDRHRAFLAWVARHHGTYRLGTDPRRLRTAWYAMRAELAGKPADGRVGAAELEDTFLPGGYHNGYWPRLAEAFAAYVRAGDTEPLVEAYDDLGAPGASTGNGYSVYTAVQCRDARWPGDWQRWRADNWAVHARAPFMGWNNAWYNAPCAFWPVEARRPVDVANDRLPPVLLFQATGDAATPYRGGATLHRLLRGSSLVVEDGGGNHGITLRGNACLDGHLAAYLTDGTVPRGHGGGEADAVCAAGPDPQPRDARTSAATPGGTLHDLVGSRPRAVD
ncbi:alpha/beta hydrolase [Streptomyces glaucescens]|uniref:alpha/beta hydrolase n=1 Tax=Streptomyces glaucescens TaxID=1907 RepID=UPI00344C5862